MAWALHIQHTGYGQIVECRSLGDAAMKRDRHESQCAHPSCITRIAFIDADGDAHQVFACDECGTESPRCAIAEDGDTVLCPACQKKEVRR